MGHRASSITPTGNVRYLTHHVCFACRSSFKRPPGENLSCLRCSGTTVDLGRYFRPPRRSDVLRWRKVRLLYEGEGSGVYAWSPPVATLREARERVQLETQEQLHRRLLTGKKRAKAARRPRRKGGRRYREAGSPVSF